MTTHATIDISVQLAQLHAALDRGELAKACGELVESLAGKVHWQIRTSHPEMTHSAPYLSSGGAVTGDHHVDLFFRKEKIGELVLENLDRIDRLGREILEDHLGIAITKLQLWKHEEAECGERRLGAELLSDISAIVGSFDRDFVLARLLEQVLRVVGSDVGSVMLQEGGSYRHPVILGLPRELTDKIEMDGVPVAKVVAEAGEPLLLENPDMSAVPTELCAVDLRLLLVIPLVNRGRVFGVLMAANPASVAHDSPYLEIAERLCHLAAIGVENSVLHARAVHRERVIAMGQVMAGLSHDIRNMLHAMQAGMYLLESGVAQSEIERAAEAYPILGSAMERVSGLVLDMLDFSMNRPPRRESVDVNKLVNEIVTANAPLAVERGIDLVSAVDPAMRTIPADSTGLFRCLSNMVTNAMEALDEGGRIELKTRWCPDSAGVFISVKDDGPGIPEGDIPRLFDALFTTKGSKGTGLGLAVTRKIIDEHNGTVAVSSVPGEGTEFILRLPKEIGRAIDHSAIVPCD